MKTDCHACGQSYEYSAADIRRRETSHDIAEIVECPHCKTEDPICLRPKK